MAFDACFLSYVIGECNRLLAEGKIEKIYQPGKEEIAVYFRKASGSHCLLINAGSQNPRVHITTEKIENPALPPMFCMMLRKHLNGARFVRMSQEGFERVARITFDAYDELGFQSQKHLICEVMGKYSNLMLVDASEKVLAVLRPVDFTTSQKRQVLPGMRYELPPSQGKENPLLATEESFCALAADSEMSRPADKFITASYCGIASLTARELVFSLTGDAGATLGDCGKPLAKRFLEMMEHIRRGEGRPYLLKDTEGKAKDYCFMPIGQYGQSVKVEECTSFSALLDRFFAERGRSERVKQQGEDIFRLLKNAESRLEKKIAVQTEELISCEEGEKFRLMGDLLTANIYRLNRGMESVTLENYMDDMKPVEIPLDTRLSPAANAQRYYKKYNKTKSAKVHLEEQIRVAGADLLYIESVLDALSRADGEKELTEIRQELRENGYGSRIKDKTAKKKQQPTILRFVTSGGYTVLCGKNNLANDHLTFHLADKNDWWFHAKQKPGSHVVMQSGREEPSERDFTEAAMIAAVYSGYSGGENVPVDYTKVKQVKKPPNAKPGYVIYHTNWTAYVNPDEDAVKALRAKGGRF